MSAARRGLAALVAAATAGLAYAVGVEPYAIALERIDLRCPRLPAQFNGYTILQVSDLHTSRMGRRERAVARMIEQLPIPDMVAVTGDLVHTTRGIGPFFEIAKRMRACDGVYAIFGNSEHKNGVDSKKLAAQMRSAGIIPLVNENLTIERGGARIRLAGVDDPSSAHDDLHAALGDIAVGEFVLLLMHSPDPIAAAVARGVDVVLSGHTHGGQVRLPIIGPLYTHSHHGRRMSSGHYWGRRLFKVIGMRPGRTNLYVTRGLGVSGLALRFLCPPELTVITLHAGRQSS